MTASTEFLDSVWAAWHHLPAWLSWAIDFFELDQADEDYLNAREDDFRNSIRGQREGGIDHGLVAEVMATEGEWARGRRREYLEGEIKRLEGELVKLKIDTGRMVMKAKTDDERRFIIPLLYPVEINGIIIKHEREIDALSCKPRKNDIGPTEVARARDYPLFRLVGANAKDRILCPFHNGEKKSLALYEKGNGYCFVCSERVDSIGYLMKTKGISFFDAVRQLQ